MRSASFLAALAAALLPALAAIAALPRLGVARPSAEIAWANDLYVQKNLIAAAITGPRILAVGGSGTLFSFDARTASAVIGKPLVNFGTHAGLGMQYILDRTARVMRPGDTIVWVPEYEFLRQSPAANAYAIQLAAFFDPAFIAAQPIGTRPQYWLGYGVLPSLVEGARWKIKGAPRGRTDIRLDAQGDARGNTVALSKGTTLTREGPVLPPPGVSPTAMALLGKFMNAARAKGVTVFVIPPALISTSGYHDPAFRRFQDSLPALFASLGMVPAGEAQGAFLAPEDMYDSIYHANDRGRARYTAQILISLCRKMTCAHAR